MMEDGVSPELRTYGARRLKEKYLESQVQRVGRAGPATTADGNFDDPIADGIITVAAAAGGAAPEGSGAGPPRGGASKGRGRGRGRRGLAPPAAPQS